MLPPSLTGRLFKHDQPNDATEGYATDWTVARLREPTRRVADRIEMLQGTDAA